MSRRKNSLSETSTHDLKTYDVFQLTPFLSVGEPYLSNKESVLKDGRSKGKQLYTKPHKSGLMNESTFGPFLTLATSEPYQPTPEFKRSATAGKPVSSRPFVPASPTKKLTGPGDTHGCFNPIEYISEGELESTFASTRPHTSASRTRTGSSFTAHTTSRSFSGTATRPRSSLGRSGTMMSGTQFTQPPFRPSSPNKTGVLGTLSPFPEYMSSGGDVRPNRSRSQTVKVPFRSMSPPLRGWDMSVFRPTTTPKPSRTRRSKSKTPQFVQPPFRPASPNKKGVLGTLSPFPEYIAGVDLQPPRRPKSSTGERQKVFMPTGAFSTNTPQPSILAMAARSMP